jgi:nitrous oxidase accessory protein
MQKRIWIIFLFSSCLQFSIWATVHPVTPETGINGIEVLIEQAMAGDTLLFGTGVYRIGNLIIRKSIKLIGVDHPVMDGEFKWEIFTIAAENVLIEGFKFINSGKSSLEDKAGVKCLDAHHVTIRNNIFDNTFFGIHLSNTDHSQIEGNILKSVSKHEYEAGNGIHLWKCTNARINNNEIQGHRDGIYFEFVTQSIIRGNKCIGNKRYGLHFMFSHDDEYHDNVFRNNGAGVAVMYTKNVKMHNNLFEENWGSSSYGVLLKDITDSEMFNNTFKQNTVGIYMEGTSRILFKHNRFEYNGWAVKLQASCDANSFEGNNFIGNTFDISTNGSLVLNTIDGNYWDKYQGYDLTKDGFGDIPYRPVSLFSYLVERVPIVIMLWRSFLVFLVDKAEKIIPAITPENLKDNKPSIKPYDLNQ